MSFCPPTYPYRKPHPASEQTANRVMFVPDNRVLMLLACVLTRLFGSRARLEAEILVLRHQLNILQRKLTGRGAFKSIDHFLVFAGLYRLVPGVLDALKILKPETVIRWHRARIPSLLAVEIPIARWPTKDCAEIRQLIRDMSVANSLWVHRGFMANCSSSASMSGKPPLPSTWRGEGSHRHRAGRPFCAIMPTA